MVLGGHSRDAMCTYIYGTRLQKRITSKKTLKMHSGCQILKSETLEI